MAAYRGSGGNENCGYRWYFEPPSSRWVRDRARPSIRNCHYPQSEIGPIRQVRVLFFFWIIPATTFVHLWNSYLDVYIGEYSIKNVLAELARCLSLFLNLHTVQIDLVVKYRPHAHVSFGEIFEQAFKKYSYPQIRNVFIMDYSVSFVASCPQARRIGFTRNTIRTETEPRLRTLLGKCPHLEILEGLDSLYVSPDTYDRVYCFFYSALYWSPNHFHFYNSQVIANDFQNLHTIQFALFDPVEVESTSSRVCAPSFGLLPLWSSWFTKSCLDQHS